jgi:hypothetical protein
MADWQSLAKIAPTPILGLLRLMASEEKVCDRIKWLLIAALASLCSLGLLEITSKTARSRHTHTKVMKVLQSRLRSSPTDSAEW